MTQGTAIRWTWWPGFKGETLTTIRGCRWAKWTDENGNAQPFITCKSCYAQNTAHSLETRFSSPHYSGLTELTSKGPIWNGQVRFDEPQLLSILTMQKPRAFFCSSMGDLFYGTTDETIAYHVAVGILAHWHRLLILTKRPDRMAALWASPEFWQKVATFVHALRGDVPKKYQRAITPNHMDYPQNIWLGTSIEGPGSAKWALDHLTGIDHPGHLWISYEPVIEPVDLTPWLRKLSWVVLGGASKQGPSPAPAFDLATAERALRDCREASVPAFLKQFGANPVSNGRRIALVDHGNHNDVPEHWPTQFRVQQFPEVA